MSSDTPMTSPVIEEEEEKKDISWKLEAVKFVPLGHAMNMFLDTKYEQEDDYEVHVHATAAYFEKHPKWVMDYRDLLIAGGKLVAQSMIVHLEKCVSEHIEFVELALKESFEEAKKIKSQILDIKRDTLLDTIMKNFTVQGDGLEVLMNVMFNLTNYSGVAIQNGLDAKNPTGSTLRLYIFNF